MKYRHPGLEAVDCTFVCFTNDGLAKIRFPDRYDSGVVQLNVPLAMLDDEGREIFQPAEAALSIAESPTDAATHRVQRQDALHAKASDTWPDIWLMNDRNMKSPKEWFMIGVEFALTTKM